MAYWVDYDALDGLYNRLSAQTSEWQQALDALNTAVQTLSESENMAGRGADSIRTYLGSVHAIIISTLSELISLHCANCLLYKQDYQQNVDRALHAVISSAELEQLRNDFEDGRDWAVGIDDQLRYSLGKVRDIFYTDRTDISDVAAAHDKLTGYLMKLDEKVRALEQRHRNADFTATGEMIAKLRSFVSEYSSTRRGYLDSFTMQELVASGAFAGLYQAHLGVEKQLLERTDAIEAAIGNENGRIAALQAEYEERQRTATAIKWIVTGVCIIGSIATIAATGGAATPLVVGAISAASGAVIAGTNNLADQYVEHGNLLENSDRIDWASFGKDVAIGGVTGFVTGCVGAGVGQAVTNGLTNTALGSSLLNSSSTLVRVGTGATIGAASQVTSGIASRGASTLIITGDLDAAVDEAFNLRNIAFDAAMGGAAGGLRAANNPPVGKEIHSSDLDSDTLATKPQNSPNPEKWMEKDGKIYIDGNGTWTYETADGVHVCYSDGYPDFNRAGLVEKKVDIGGFNTEGNSRSADFSKANQISPKSPTTTWHHSQDGHTLEAVDTYYHKIFTHRGGFSISKMGG